MTRLADLHTGRTRGRPVARKKELPIYVSLDEAAEIMSLSTRTIRRRISDGTIPAYQCGRRPIRIRLDELEVALRRIPSARF
jgi:excisionase family DNA binding protein